MTAKTRKVVIPKNAIEWDAILVMPDEREVCIQYRNYAEEPSIDIILSKPLLAHSWLGADMRTAPRVKGQPAHVRLVDQICLV